MTVRKEKLKEKKKVLFLMHKMQYIYIHEYFIFHLFIYFPYEFKFIHLCIYSMWFFLLIYIFYVVLYLPYAIYVYIMPDTYFSINIFFISCQRYIKNGICYYIMYSLSYFPDLLLLRYFAFHCICSFFLFDIVLLQ